jgi:hypothetical protein
MSSITKWLTLSILLTGPVAANAALTYNYSQDYVYDSATGLYWQIEAVPTPSFQPSGTGQLATTQQLEMLFNTYGGVNAFLPNAGSYSPAIANLAAFFAGDTPARTNSRMNTASSYSIVGFLADSGYSNPIRVDWYGGQYSGTSLSSSDWSLGLNGTVDLLPVNNPAAFRAAWCPVAGTTCPTEFSAFVVSNTAPVPLPESAWLMLSALGSLGIYARKNSRSNSSVRR